MTYINAYFVAGLMLLSLVFDGFAQTSNVKLIRRGDTSGASSSMVVSTELRRLTNSDFLDRWNNIDINGYDGLRGDAARHQFLDNIEYAHRNNLDLPYAYTSQDNSQGLTPPSSTYYERHRHVPKWKSFDTGERRKATEIDYIFPPLADAIEAHSGSDTEGRHDAAIERYALRLITLIAGKRGGGMR